MNPPMDQAAEVPVDLRAVRLVVDPVVRRAGHLPSAMRA